MIFLKRLFFLLPLHQTGCAACFRCGMLIVARKKAGQGLFLNRLFPFFLLVGMKGFEPSTP